MRILSRAPWPVVLLVVFPASETKEVSSLPAVSVVFNNRSKLSFIKIDVVP